MHVLLTDMCNNVHNCLPWRDGLACAKRSHLRLDHANGLIGLRQRHICSLQAAVKPSLQLPALCLVDVACLYRRGTLLQPPVEHLAHAARHALHEGLLAPIAVGDLLALAARLETPSHRQELGTAEQQAAFSEAPLHLSGDLWGVGLRH